MATTSTTPRASKRAREPFHQSVRDLDVARHRIRELQHQLFVVAENDPRRRTGGTGIAGLRAPVPDRVHFRVRDTRLPGVRHVRLELERRPIQHRHPENDELAQIGRNARLVAHGRQELFPARGEGRAVQQHLIENRDAAPLLGDRALDGGELRARARRHQRDADRRRHRVDCDGDLRAHMGTSLIRQRSSCHG